MKILFLFALLLQGSLLSCTQTAGIKGQIQDRLNGQGFPFVEVMVGVRDKIASCLRLP